MESKLPQTLPALLHQASSRLHSLRRPSVTMKTSLFLFAALLCARTTLARNKPATDHKHVKKESAIYQEPKPAESRISRSSLYSAVLPQPSSYKLQQYQQPYSYPLVLSPQYTASALASLGRATSSKQLKKPVYHSTPLETYSSLLEHSEQSPKTTVLEVDSASLGAASHGATNQYAADYSAAYQAALKEASGGSSKLAEVAIPEPKYAPVVYKHAATSTHYREDDDKHDEYAAKYQFGYQVRDPKHGSYYGHSEARDGHVTKGHYHVLLPDGRLQNVQYYADLTGFHAQVSYNGVAKHSTASAHGLSEALAHAA